MRRQLIMYVCLFFASVFLMPLEVFARNTTITGMYGIPTGGSDRNGDLASQLAENNVSAVFVPPDMNTINFFKEQGFEVFLTLNVFGGRQPWKEFPDSVPIVADGTKLSGKYGGICPTHFEWRESRLQLLDKWLKDFSEKDGVSGIWLDFIRYPGSWEHADAVIPDTCYCDRCLTLFQVEKGVDLPDGLDTAQVVRWIHQYAESKWSQWKKEQITSFVRDARTIIDSNRKGNNKVRLGVFLVPWMQGEKEGAVTFLLGQDAELFAGYVDVFSPMVYHRMVKKTPDWIADVTEYFAEMTGKTVAPIIQAEDLKPDEFKMAVEAVTRGDGGGILVYTYRKMDETFWPLLADFSPQKNILQDNRFQSVVIADEQLYSETTHNAAGETDIWNKGSNEQGNDAVFQVLPITTGRGKRCFGITGGMDRGSLVEQTIPVCTPGKSYLFSGDFFRHTNVDRAYPELEIWGQTHILNTHRVSGKFQHIRLHLSCTDGLDDNAGVFHFINRYPGQTFWLQSPRLLEKLSSVKKFHKDRNTGFFPIGAYGGNPDNLAEFKDLGLNSSILRLSKRALDMCGELRMHCTFALPHDSEKIKILLDSVGPFPESGSFSFYINDEPGIHSFPRWKARDIERLLEERYPDIPTMMAVVRPQVILDYEQAADFFMLDQYPVPSMPMSWLADSMDMAADVVGRDRLQSVIQAFGGKKWEKYGWPMMPTFEEMNNLAFLSLVHGSRGIYFFKYQAAMATEQGKEDLKAVVVRLQKLLPWLQSKNNFEQVAVDMTSINRVDPQGNPGVHCAVKIRGRKRMLVCANTLRTYASADMDMGGTESQVWQDFYSGKELLAVQSSLELDFLPLEVKVLVQE